MPLMAEDCGKHEVKNGVEFSLFATVNAEPKAVTNSLSAREVHY